MKPPPGVHHQSGEVVSSGKLFMDSSRHHMLGMRSFPCVGRILLSLYVDDMIITGDDCDGIELLKAELSHCFDIKDLGLLRYFLDNKIVDIPIDAKAKYTYIDGDPLHDPSLYHTVLGVWFYLTVTRPDIAYVVYI
nr:hypothetical protein [Tanacetum cinerariifolium]